MPIENFNRECFVAFTDISGFKVMMKDDQKAIRAIDRFYSAGYHCLQSDRSVNGFFVSDCGILFSRAHDQESQLESLLNVVKDLNQRVRRSHLMLTTSIAWGRFSYQNRIRFVGIEKQAIYGNAYTTAYLDNEAGKPRIQPGQCRIVRKGIDNRVFKSIKQRDFLEIGRDHASYFWMVNHPSEIRMFKQRYADTYNLRFAGMLQALGGGH